MILADKIIDLRKKNDWSQEELAEKLDVSRQAISKWEGAQSVPDLSRVIRMAELFGVSTDYLLKDDMDAPVPAESASAPGGDARPVTMEDANAFLAVREENAKRVSLGVLLCILCPIPVLLLLAMGKYAALGLNEAQAAAISCSLLFLMIGAAVALFVISGIRGRRFAWLREEPIDTLYGVDGMVKERRERFHPSFALQLTLGIVLCVLCVLPIFVALFAFGEDAEAPMVAASAVLLAMIGVGVMLIVRSAMVMNGFKTLLEEGDYSRAEKEQSKAFGPFAGIYWLAVTAVFLLVSFLTRRWDVSWIIWPVAALGYAIAFGVIRAMRKKEQ